MSGMPNPRYTTEVSRLIKAPRSEVYRALLDPLAVAEWLHLDGMSCHVHAFDPREGGAFHMSLTYLEPKQAGAGKTSDRTDAFRGRFLTLIPDQRVVERIEFESSSDALKGDMTITISLADAPGGTEVTWLHENVPAAIRPEDNKVGTQMTLENLARLLEGSASEQP